MSPQSSARPAGTEAPAVLPASGTGPAKAGTAGPAGEAHGSTVARKPLINYYQRMLVGQIYPLDVNWVAEQGRGAAPVYSGNGALSGSGTVVVQPVIPGAIVTPPTAELSSDATGAVRFWVTPQACSRLRGARVDFLRGGQALASVRLSMRAGRRRLTWLLLLLTFAVPLGFLYLKTHHWEPSGLITEPRKHVEPPPIGDDGPEPQPGGPGAGGPPAGGPGPMGPMGVPGFGPGAGGPPRGGPGPMGPAGAPKAPEATKDNKKDAQTPNTPKPEGADAKTGSGSTPPADGMKPVDDKKPGESADEETFEGAPAEVFDLVASAQDPKKDEAKKEEPAKSGAGEAPAKDTPAAGTTQGPGTRPNGPGGGRAGGGRQGGMRPGGGPGGPAGGPPAGGPGGGGAPGGFPAPPGLPPPPKEHPFVSVPYTGERYLERWIETEYERREKDPVAVLDTYDFVILGLGRAKPVVTNTYYGFDFVRKMQLSELYLFVILLVLTVLVWAWQSPSRGRTRGPVIELPA